MNDGCGLCHECLNLLTIWEGHEYCPTCREQRFYQAHGADVSVTVRAKWLQPCRPTIEERARYLLQRERPSVLAALDQQLADGRSPRGALVRVAHDFGLIERERHLATVYLDLWNVGKPIRADAVMAIHGAFDRSGGTC